MKLSKIELDLLAQDVRNNINQTLDITKFTLTASCLMLGFAFSNTDKAGSLIPVICLLPIPLIIAAIEMIFNRRTNIMRKATFLRKYGGKDYKWELFLKGLRNEIQKKPVNEISLLNRIATIFIGNKSKSSFTKTIFKMLIIMCYICILSSIGFIVYYYVCSDLSENSNACFNNYYKDPFVYISAVVAILVFIYSIIKGIKIDSILMGGDAENKAFEKWDKVESELMKSNPKIFEEDDKRYH